MVFSTSLLEGLATSVFLVAILSLSFTVVLGVIPWLLGIVNGVDGITVSFYQVGWGVFLHLSWIELGGISTSPLGVTGYNYLPLSASSVVIQFSAGCG